MGGSYHHSLQAQGQSGMADSTHTHTRTCTAQSERISRCWAAPPTKSLGIEVIALGAPEATFWPREQINLDQGLKLLNVCAHCNTNLPLYLNQVIAFDCSTK